MKNAEFIGFDEIAKDFIKFDVLNSMADPDFNGVYALLIEIPEMKSLGLCIYSELREDFLEEPGDFDGYNETIESMTEKYPILLKDIDLSNYNNDGTRK